MDKDAKAIGNRLRALIARDISRLTLKINANLIKATPVDTGHARRNWIPSIGEPLSVEAWDEQMQASGITRVAAYRLGDGPLLSITNNVPYIERLIGGSSDQAALGWDIVAIDRAVAAMGENSRIAIDVTVARNALVAERGGDAADNLADAYSPLGSDE